MKMALTSLSLHIWPSLSSLVYFPITALSLSFSHVLDLNIRLILETIFKSSNLCHLNTDKKSTMVYTWTSMPLEVFFELSPENGRLQTYWTQSESITMSISVLASNALSVLSYTFFLPQRENTEYFIWQFLKSSLFVVVREAAVELLSYDSLFLSFSSHVTILK